MQVLTTEMVKTKLDIALVIMNDIFQIRESNCIRRNYGEFQSHRLKTVHYSTETVSFLGPKLWSTFDQE